MDSFLNLVTYYGLLLGHPVLISGKVGTLSRISLHISCTRRNIHLFRYIHVESYLFLERFVYLLEKIFIEDKWHFGDTSEVEWLGGRTNLKLNKKVECFATQNSNQLSMSNQTIWKECQRPHFYSNEIPYLGSNSAIAARHNFFLCWHGFSCVYIFNFNVILLCDLEISFNFMSCGPRDNYYVPCKR